MSARPDRIQPRQAALLSLALTCCCSCLTFETQVAIDKDATQAAKGFSPEIERRMIFTYESRIYEEAEDYLRAIASLKERLAEYPRTPPKSKQVVFKSEKALLNNQIATCEFRLGRYRDALRHYQESLKLAQELKIVHGVVVNSANIGQVVLRMLDNVADKPHAASQAQSWVNLANRVQSAALALIAEPKPSDAKPDESGETPEYPHREYRMYLRSNLAALAQRAAALGVRMPRAAPSVKGNEG